MEAAPRPDAILRDPGLSPEQWEYAIAKLRQITASGSCAADQDRVSPSEAEGHRSGPPTPRDDPDAVAGNLSDPKLGIPSVDLREEQAFLDAGREKHKLPKMKVEAKNAIWARGKIIGVQWRGVAYTAHTGKKTWIMTHYRKDYPDSSLLFIAGQRRRVLAAPIW